jgi:Na+/proline symporter
MLFALLALPLLAIINFGGFSETFTALVAMDATLDPFAISFGAALGFVGIGLGSPGSPHILIRFMSVDDPRQLRYVAHVGTLWNVLMALGAVAIGILGKLYFTDVSMLPGADTEQLFPELARQLLHPFLFGLILAAIFAAIMSTADSQLLVAASGLVRDLYEKMFQRGDAIPQRTMVLYSRLAVTMLVVLSTALALIAEELVFWLVLFAWAGMGASIGPTSILALYWKRTTRAGVIAGLVSGTLTAILWYLTPALKGVLYELIPAFLVSLVVTVLVSLATQPPDDADDMFEEMH